MVFLSPSKANFKIPWLSHEHFFPNIVLTHKTTLNGPQKGIGTMGTDKKANKVYAPSPPPPVKNKKWKKIFKKYTKCSLLWVNASRCACNNK
jgi:hypothetical protein